MCVPCNALNHERPHTFSLYYVYSCQSHVHLVGCSVRSRAIWQKPSTWPFPFPIPVVRRRRVHTDNQNRSSSFSLVCTHGAQSLSRCVGFSANANTRTMRAVHYSPWTASALSLFRMNVLARVRKHDGGDTAAAVMHALQSVGATLDDVVVSCANNHHHRIAPFERQLPWSVELASLRAQASMPTICCLARHATSEKAGSRSDAR